MKIIDNFLFRNEYDLLEIRLSTHYDHVDQFVIVESDHTFTGIYKGFNLAEHKERYARWWDKVTYVQLGKPPHSRSIDAENWERDHFQLQWGELDKNDIVVVTDLDEIIRPEAFKFMKETDYNFYRLGMPFFNFKFNYLCLTGHNPWPSAKAFRGYVTPGYGGMRGVESVPDGKHVSLHHAGWHFSYLGDEAWIIQKLGDFCDSHGILTEDYIKTFNISEKISRGEDFASRPGFTFTTVKLDDYFPKALIDNLSKYGSHVLPDTEKSVLDYIPGSLPQIL